MVSAALLLGGVLAQASLSPDQLLLLEQLEAQQRVEPPPAPARARPMVHQGGSLPLALLEGLYRGYKGLVSDQNGASCTFSPSCSTFGMEVVERCGVVPGVLLTLDRLQRDHPFSRGAYEISPTTGLRLDPALTWCPEELGR